MFIIITNVNISIYNTRKKTNIIIRVEFHGYKFLMLFSLYMKPHLTVFSAWVSSFLLTVLIELRSIKLFCQCNYHIYNTN